MKKILLTTATLFALHATAQKTITIVLENIAGNKTDSLYLAGNINNWNPADKRFLFTSNKLVVEAAPANKLEFKITRGNWSKVECSASGNDIGNRTIHVQGDTLIRISIAGWKDDYREAPKQHTASAQVSVLDTAFFIPQLNRHRTIRVYLPKDYAAGTKHYPVLYMHDGQNCFDEFTSGFGEWQVDETLDSLQPGKNGPCIVVAIDHGGPKRMTEYNPYNNQRFGTGEGKSYIDFIAQTLKPFIDQKLRTQPGSSSTFIAGSSMGGLISLWAVMAYPNVFGGAGIFSPSCWIAPDLKADAARMLKNYTGKLYFYAGGKESKTMVSDMDAVIAVLSGYKHIRIKRRVMEDAAHNEAAWRRVFPEFVQFTGQ